MKPTAEILRELKELSERATPGPWTRDNPMLGEDEGIWILAPDKDDYLNSIASVRRGCLEAGPESQNLPDAEFIAESRTALPKLIAALELAIEQRNVCIKMTYGYTQTNARINSDDAKIEEILNGADR
jgi:hypothetical protein